MTPSITPNKSDLYTNYPWIDKLLFEKFIRKDYQSDEIVVEQFELEAALPKGENYCSQMIRAKVNYVFNGNVQKRINFVIKATASFQQNDLFVREIAVFNNVIPLAEGLLRDIGDDTKLSAKCYEANSEKYYLVFEDLAMSGYKNIDKRLGLAMDHFKNVFSKLAKWHATTAVLFQTKPHVMLPFMNAFKTKYFETVCINIMKTVTQFTKTLPGYERLTKKLEMLSAEIYRKIEISMERYSDDFNCLCHIDLWTNNIMFNEALPTNSLLVDFQMVYLGSPLLDICYSLYTSSDVSIRASEFESLLCYYHQELLSILRKLRYMGEIPTLESLSQQMLIKGVYGVPFGLFETVNRYLETDKDNMDLFAAESDDAHKFRLDMFMNPNCRDRLLFLLSYFESRGYFDT